MHVSDTQKKYLQCFNMISFSERKFLSVNGNSIIVAVNHLKKLMLIGGILRYNPRATMKLPDQTMAASTAKPTPM